MENSDQTVCIVGQGYVGLPLAYAAWVANYKVVGLDIDHRKVNMISSGVSPIDDVTDVMLEEMLNSGDYKIIYDTSFLNEDPDVIVVTVPTPLTDGRPDLSYVTDAARAIARHAYHSLVILESTVAPGTTGSEFLAALQDANPKLDPGVNFDLAFSPERIDPGNTDYDITSTDKLVGGYTDVSRDRAVRFYQRIINRDSVHPVSSMEVAETAKLLENTFRHVNIALVNELARHCHALGISVWDVINAAATKPYGFMPFYPGPGVGGHCLPVDPAYLSERVKMNTGDDFHFVDLAMRINNSQPGYVVQRLTTALNERFKPMNGSHILVMGYSYKANTSDSRETPADAVLMGLVNLGAHVYVYEPHSNEGAHFKSLDDAEREVADARDGRLFDAVVLLTNHDDFTEDYSRVCDYGVPVLDTRNAFPDGSKYVIKL